MTQFLFESRRLAPEAASVTIEAGRASTSRRDVMLAVATPDYLSGQRSAYQMKVWGDIDPNMDGRIQATEGQSEYLAYTPELPLVLSVGEGTKTVRVKMRNQTMRESLTTTASIEFVDDDPHVSVLWRSRRRRFGSQPGSMRLVWNASQDFTEWQVCAAASLYATREECAVIASGVGAWEAGEVIEVAIPDGTAWDAVDIIPQSGSKVGKIFVKTATGWSD